MCSAHHSWANHPTPKLFYIKVSNTDWSERGKQTVCRAMFALRLRRTFLSQEPSGYASNTITTNSSSTQNSSGLLDSGTLVMDSQSPFHPTHGTWSHPTPLLSSPALFYLKAINLRVLPTPPSKQVSGHGVPFSLMT